MALRKKKNPDVFTITAAEAEVWECHEALKGELEAMLTRLGKSRRSFERKIMKKYKIERAERYAIDIEKKELTVVHWGSPPPDLNGEEAVKAIRARGNMSPAQALQALAGEKRRERAAAKEKKDGTK